MSAAAKQENNVSGLSRIYYSSINEESKNVSSLLLLPQDLGFKILLMMFCVSHGLFLEILFKILYHLR